MMAGLARLSSLNNSGYKMEYKPREKQILSRALKLN